MPNFSKNEVALVRYPFTDLTGNKVRPAVVVNAPSSSEDLFLVPLTSKTENLVSGEFQLTDWKSAGLHVPTAAKRGLYTVHSSLIIKTVGFLATRDATQLQKSLRLWLGL
jgi:mRNA interferase MazF